MNRFIIIFLTLLNLNIQAEDRFDDLANKIFEKMRNDFQAFDNKIGQMQIDNQFGSSNFSTIDKSQEETKDFIIIKIHVEDVKNNPLDINVKKGMVTLKGEIKKTEEKKTPSGTSYSSHTSIIQESFPVPQNCQTNYEIELTKDEIILKFPKMKS